MLFRSIRMYILDYPAMAFVHSHPNVPGRAYGGLAKQWAMGADGRTYYFRIDPAARWSDGKPITTADVVFTFYFMRSPLLREPWYNDFYTKTYERLTIYDALTFAITLPQPKPDGVIRAGNIVPYPRHAFQDFGADWIEKYQWRTLPTTAAYELLDRNIDKGRSITLTKEIGFTDSWFAATQRRNETLNSFNGFGKSTFNSARIDWILYRGEAEVPSAEVVDLTPGGRQPSDHFPVYARMTWK